MRIGKQIRVVKTRLQRANADGYRQGSKDVKSTTPAKLGKDFFAKIWKENAVKATDRNQNEDSDIAATVGGNGDTIKEVETSFGISRQLAPATFKMVENQSFHSQIAVAVDSVIYVFCDLSTAEELVMFDVFFLMAKMQVVLARVMWFGV